MPSSLLRFLCSFTDFSSRSKDDHREQFFNFCLNFVKFIKKKKLFVQYQSVICRSQPKLWGAPEAKLVYSH